MFLTNIQPCGSSYSVKWGPLENKSLKSVFSGSPCITTSQTKANAHLNFNFHSMTAPSWQGFRPLQKQANAHLNFDNSSPNKYRKPSQQALNPPSTGNAQIDCSTFLKALPYQVLYTSPSVIHPIPSNPFTFITTVCSIHNYLVSLFFYQFHKLHTSSTDTCKCLCSLLCNHTQTPVSSHQSAAGKSIPCLFGHF